MSQSPKLPNQARVGILAGVTSRPLPPWLISQVINMQQDFPDNLAQAGFNGINVQFTLTEEEREKMINHCIKMQELTEKREMIGIVSSVASVALTIVGIVAIGFSISAGAKHEIGQF
jgi:hypothetical protein